MVPERGVERDAKARVDLLEHLAEEPAVRVCGAGCRAVEPQLIFIARLDAFRVEIAVQRSTKIDGKQT